MTLSIFQGDAILHRAAPERVKEALLTFTLNLMIKMMICLTGNKMKQASRVLSIIMTGP